MRILIIFTLYFFPCTNYGFRATDNQVNSIRALKNPVSKCSKDYDKCFDASRCIPHNKWCDGIVDCPDSSDEIHCTCRDRIIVYRRCDGYSDCPRGEDELNCFTCPNDLLSYVDWTEKILQASCISLSLRCDGKLDYKNGRDEQDCHLLTESFIDNDDILTVGYSSGYLFKNWHGKWYPACTSTESWAKEACQGETGSLKGSPTIKRKPVHRSHKLGPYISMSESGKIELVPECDDQAVFVKCPSIPCGTVLSGPDDNISYFEDIRVTLPHQLNSSTETTVPDYEIYEDLSNLGKISGDFRIAGGRASGLQAWPFVVAIYRDGNSVCGGSIIDENWVLTAAHCIESDDNHYYQIFAGLLRHSSFAPMVQVRQAKFVVPHPEYDNCVFKNDLALIKLNEPLRFNRWIRAICLPIPAWGAIPTVNEICTVIGWGAIAENSSKSDHLREVEVPIVANCSYESDRSSGIVCAGRNKGGRDACHGDSGGPLMCRIPGSQRWYVAGVVSNGVGCARPNKTAAFTRVSYYHPWIRRIIDLDREPFGPKPLANCPGFKCHGDAGKCLPLNRRCDKNVDCMNAEDETNCDRFEAEWIYPKYPDDFTCSNVSQSISGHLRCNQKIDCQDGTDELNCRCVDILHNQHPLSICDWRFDCADKSDEQDCEKCNPNYSYLCPRSGDIILAEKRCNGVTDCQLYDDEMDCYALTNGEDIELDLEGSTTFKKNGIVSVNENNSWSINCFENITKDLKKVADEYCSILGFDKHEFASLHWVGVKKLEVYTCSNNSNSITFDRDEIIESISKKNLGPVMCYALYIDCRMNFKGSAYEYVYLSKTIKNITFLLPWESAIFVDGKYHCPALLLNTNWAMTSTRCTNDINLAKNISAVVAGLSIPHRYVDGPHQQTRMVNHIVKMDKFHIALLHFDQLPLTRYIKPIFINKIILPADEGDYCQATGVDDELEKKSTGFNATVEDCPSGKRCFRNSLKNSCPKNGTTQNWSGFVSCHNSRGWYLAAVFHEKDIICDFTDPQTLTGTEEIFPYLYIIMDQNDFTTSSAQCDARGIQCTEGKCVQLEKLCDGIQDCRDGSDENKTSCLRKQDHCNQLSGDKPDSLCGCSIHQLRCSNGKCIPKNMFCNTFDDCGDGSDEPPGCSCRDYLNLTSPHRLCNKVRDCYDKSDEDHELCSCSNKHYTCLNSSVNNGKKRCIPYDFVCDGQKDCPQGDDESLCRLVQSADGVSNTAGRVLKRQLGIWFDECFPLPINSDNQAEMICQTMGYSGGVLLDENSRRA